MFNSLFLIRLWDLTEQPSPGHLLIGFLCHREDVGIHVPHVLAAVGVDDILLVDRQLLVGIDGHEDNALEEINTQIGYKASPELMLQDLELSLVVSIYFYFFFNTMLGEKK